MSVPAQKNAGPPVSTATRTESSSANSLNAASRASVVGPSIALRFSGRSMVITVTAPRRSTRTVIDEAPAHTEPMSADAATGLGAPVPAHGLRGGAEARVGEQVPQRCE